VKTEPKSPETEMKLEQMGAPSRRASSAEASSAEASSAEAPLQLPPTPAAADANPWNRRRKMAQQSLGHAVPHQDAAAEPSATQALGPYESVLANAYAGQAVGLSPTSPADEGASGLHGATAAAPSAEQEAHRLACSAWLAPPADLATGAAPQTGPANAGASALLGATAAATSATQEAGLADTPLQSSADADTPLQSSAASLIAPTASTATGDAPPAPPVLAQTAAATFAGPQAPLAETPLQPPAATRDSDVDDAQRAMALLDMLSRLETTSKAAAPGPPPNASQLPLPMQTFCAGGTPPRPLQSNCPM